MFSFLQKKVEIQLQLNSTKAQIGAKISGKVTITSTEGFISNSLEIHFVPSIITETFDYPPLMKRVI